MPKRDFRHYMASRLDDLGAEPEERGTPPEKYSDLVDSKMRVRPRRDWRGRFRGDAADKTDEALRAETASAEAETGTAPEAEADLDPDRPRYRFFRREAI